MQNPLLIGLTCGGAFLLSFLLFNHPRNNNLMANKWLAFFVATFALAMLEIFLHNLNLHTKYPKVLALAEVSRFLSGPTLYLSILFFTTPSKKFKRTDLWHFIPFMLFLIFLMSNIWRGKNLQFENELATKALLTILIFSLPIQILLYMLFSYQRLKQHQRNIQQVTSAIEAVDLSWLKNFFLIFLIVLIIWLNLAFFNFTPLHDFTPFLYLLSLYFLAYFSLRQKEVYAFATAELKELEPIISASNQPKMEKQKRLSDSQVIYLKDKLEHLMLQEKVFLDNELGLPLLAHKMKISAHELSYLINEVYSENFYAFVNKFRVEEAKNLLLSEKPEQLNMLGIAYQAGFNSKTTFNTAFKKCTGQSPTEFLQSAKDKNQLMSA